ncbi:MAG TPA: TonB family protein [Steroidobacteraceae bacterium]|nr:TonB family protein [Steroidobacteraceae bacterium]
MRVLLVDHDSEGLEAIARAIRGVLELDCVTSKGDAMLLLRQNTYDVLIACERCVDGSGLDLLGRTTRTTAPLKRIFAAPPDRLQLLGPRLAPFKVQRTINYPIDLEELWLAIAQVTGTNDETDGTIERVVLDERGIPSNGTTPRAPIPSRPPAPLRTARQSAPPAPAPAPAVAAPMAAVAAAANAGRATARAAQPAPEPPLRAPPPPRQPPQVRAPAPPATTSDTGRMRAPLSASDTGRMRALAATPPPTPRREEPSWNVETVEDDFAQVAQQARMGVERKGVDEAAKRKKQRLITAGAIAAVVAGVIVFLIEKFYDPAARAREQAIAAEVTRMDEQRKFTDSLTMIEVDIEKAIMDNNLELARQELARLVERAPEHPRREFLQASIDRAAELAKLAAQRGSANDSAGSAETERPASRQRPAERATRDVTPARNTARERVVERAPAQAPADRANRAASNNTRSYGAPINDVALQRSIPLNAPINAEPVLTSQRSGSSFGGRTVEASDAVGSNATATSSVPGNQSQAGSAAPVVPPAAAPAPSVPAAVDVTPARILKRIAPVAPTSVAARTGGYVVVSFTVTDGGKVADVEVVESAPRGVFDGAAQAAVRKWTYEPRKENGVAVNSTAKARLVFEPAN